MTEPAQPDPIAEVISTLNTFTEEAQDAALAKCVELNFDVNRGVVPWDESFINLRSARAVLLDAADNRKLVQLPLTVQTMILSKVREVSRALSGLMAGRDEGANLSKGIEDLHVTMWQFRLDNLSPELLGYQTKLNELKRLQKQVGELKTELKGAVGSKKRLETIVENAEGILTKLQETLTNSTDTESKMAAALERVKELEQQVGATQRNAQQNENAVLTLASTARASAAEISTREQKVTEFFGEVAKFRSQMEEASDLQTETAAKWEKEAKQRVEESEAQKKNLVDELKDLEAEIRNHLQNAVGASLFHSFGQRQTSLAKLKQQWSTKLAAALALVFALGVGLIYEIHLTGVSYTPAFFLKLSLTLPFIYYVYFCAIQYDRERRLEEEYAFKSNISVSLVAYRDLVEKLVNHENEPERQKYTDFMVGAIQEIFRPPTTELSKKSADVPLEKLADTILSGAAEVVKAVRK